MNNIAIIKRVGEKPERVRIVGETYDLIKSVIEGCFDVVRVGVLEENNIDIFVDDEGKLLELDPNILILDRDTEEMVDYIAGDVIFLSYDNEGNSIGLTEKQLEILDKEVFDEACILTKEADEVLICNVIKL